MRRAIVLFTVATFVVVGLAVVVRADSPRTPRADADAGVVAGVQLERPTIRTLRAVPTISCDESAGPEIYIRCLHKYLNRLASNLNQTISRLEQTQAEVVHWYECMTAKAITQYGEDPAGGTFGYLWDSGDGYGPWMTTALDFTLDQTTESFLYFVVVDPACVAA